VRFIIGGTIEERILKLQDKKRAVFEGTVGKDASALVGRRDCNDHLSIGVGMFGVVVAFYQLA
jgi:SNF2 family DNA or RNA helicase